MSRPTAEQLRRLQAFFDTLPADQKDKCSLCNETLTHIVKQAESEAGVGTTTAARVLAEQINETARPADRVSGDQLRDRVRRSAGEKLSGRTAQITQEVEREIKAGKSVREAAGDVAEKIGKKTETVRKAYSQERERSYFKDRTTQAMQIAQIAILQLERIADGDPERHDAFNLVRVWMDAEEATCSG